jgi:diguanylate cyclase (GGDEF)-like protein/PAS domain S-box-containing protein
MSLNGHLDISLDRLLDLLPDAVCAVDAENRFIFISAGGERIFGYAPEEMLGRSMYDFIHPEDRERTRQAAGNIAAGIATSSFRNRYVRKDGHVVPIMWSARVTDHPNEVGPPGMRVAVARDFSYLHAAELRQTALYSIAECANTHIGDLYELLTKVIALVAPVIPVRACGILLQPVDEAASAYSANENGPDRGGIPSVDASRMTRIMVNRPPSDSDGDADSSGHFDAEHDFKWGAAVIRSASAQPLSDPCARPVLQCAAHAELPPDDWQGVELRYHNNVLGSFFVHIALNDPQSSEVDSGFLRFVATQIAAVVARQQTEARLRHMAAHDTLTDLPNRALLSDRLRGALALTQRNPASEVALLYLDLDGFKDVNDRFGHSTGDALLKAVARRLSGCVRTTDTVARIGGDEFLLLLQGDDAATAAQAVTTMVQHVFDEPFEIGDHVLRISPSIGCVIAPRHAGDAETLMRLADAAMYRAKRAGGNQLKMALAD